MWFKNENVWTNLFIRILIIEIIVFTLFWILFLLRNYYSRWTIGLSFPILVISLFVHILGYVGPILVLVFKEWNNKFAFSVVIIINLLTCLIPCTLPYGILHDIYPSEYDDDELSLFRYLRLSCIPPIQRKIAIMIFYFIIFLFSFISNLCTTPAYLSQNCELLRNLYISLIAVSLIQIVMMLFSIFMKRINKYIRLFLLYLTIISGIALSIVIFVFYKKSTCDLKLYNY